jgi:hypothetical protein
MHQPHFADLQQVAHTAFVQGEVDILRVAAVILAFGALAGFFLIRPQDMYQEESVSGASIREGTAAWRASPRHATTSILEEAMESGPGPAA